MDRENGAGEIIGRVRKREEVKANPKSTKVGDIESVSGMMCENSGTFEQRK